MRKNDPRSDVKEYATGNNENPLAVAPEVPRPADHFAEMVAANELHARKAPWYPKAEGPPETHIPSRAKSWEVTKSALNISVQPQHWDVFNVNVPATGGIPVELWAAKASRASILVTNTGVTAILISPDEDKARNGVGVSVAAGATFTIDTSGPGWVVSSGAASTAQVITTWYEDPKHLPPKKEEG